MRKKLGLAGMYILALLMVTPVICAGVFVPTAAQAVTNGVIIEGNQRVERATILQYLQFGPNEAVTSENIDASIKSLFATGLFADVKIDRRGSNIVIHVVENPMINRVNFEGNEEIDDTTLQKEVEVHQNMIYTKSRVQSDTRRVLALYQAKGFYNVRVDPQLIQLPDNRVNVAFQISENGKTEINEINFIGNKSLSADRLRGEMITKQKAWWNPFGKNTTYDPDRLEYDKELVRRFYLKNGFADIQVTGAEAHLKPDGTGFVITMTVDEGPRYSIGDVAVNIGTGNNLNGNLLRSKVRTGVGDVFDASKVDKSVEALTLEASDEGFTFAKVEPKVDRNADGHTVNITYNITEGDRVYVERIDITGNNRTRDYVIRRELQLYEGDAYNPTLVERARRRLTALNYFDKVDFKQSPGSAPDKIILDVDVSEKSTGSLTFSIGYSSTETIVGTVEYAERNLFGMGYQQNISTSASFVKQSINYSFTDPYFLGSNISAGFDIFANNADNQSSSSYSSTQYGGALRTGFKLDEYQSMNFKYTLAYRQIYGVDTDVATPLAISEEGNTWKNAVTATYVYDAVDNPSLPTSGLRAMLTGELAGLGDAQYAKAEGKSWYFLPLFEDQVVVKFQGTAGHIQSLGNEVNLQDRFFKGADSFRGFSSGGVGPMQMSNDNGNWQSIGAKDYAIGTVEATFPLGLPQAFGISGAVFTDFGTVFNGGNVPTGLGTGYCSSHTCSAFDDPTFRLSVGAGIVWQSPFGPLRFDYAYPILKADSDSVQYWRFSLGTRF